MTITRQTRWGFSLVLLGLGLQIAAALVWTPGTFMLSAGLGLPLVVVGALVLWRGTRGAP